MPTESTEDRRRCAICGDIADRSEGAPCAVCTAHYRWSVNARRCARCGLLDVSIIHTDDGVLPDGHAFALRAFPSEAEANRLLTTDRPRVVPAPNEAMHIDAGNGSTLCGRPIGEIHGRPTIAAGRISCIRCGRIADLERVEAARS
jgi:hypothetical protein